MEMFFNGWSGLLRIVLVGVLAYVALIILLRVSGKRTLSKMNAFDFVVTIALGSTLATVLLSKTTPLVDGVVALALLIFLQYVITWLSVRSKAFSKLVKAEPKLLFYRGDFISEVMRQERVNEGEVLQAMRKQGVHNYQDVEAVVLESDGNLSIIQGQSQASASALTDVATASGHSSRLEETQ